MIPILQMVGTKGLKEVVELTQGHMTSLRPIPEPQSEPFSCMQ